ncbi:hypothetical protein T09_12372 [Trichinella sp. T9]|nr:hypothetical protein T09_12372 [Trichinella sp. T9]
MGMGMLVQSEGTGPVEVSVSVREDWSIWGLLLWSCPGCSI